MAEDTEIAVGIDVLKPGAKYLRCDSYAALSATWDTVANGEACPAEITVRAAGQSKLAEIAAEATTANYLQAFFTNRKAIGAIFMTFSEGFRTAGASPSLAQYRTVLSETLVKIYALPSAFTNEFDTERTALALPALNGAPNYAASLTLAQCQTWHNFLGNWIGRVMAGAAIASAVKA